MTEMSKTIETRAIKQLLEDSYVLTIPLNIQPKTPNKLTKLWRKLTGKKNNYDKHIPKSLKIQTQHTTDPETKKQKKHYTCQLHITPLYLGTIDNIRKHYLRINYDEKRLQQNPLQESRKLFKHIDTMTEIGAIATLNTSPKHLKNYNKHLNSLKHFYKEHLTPKTLLQLTQLINLMSNPADFTNSIRLTQTTETTAPKAHLVE